MSQTEDGNLDDTAAKKTEEVADLEAVDPAQGEREPEQVETTPVCPSTSKEGIRAVGQRTPTQN